MNTETEEALFAEEFAEPRETPAVILDRSASERWAECPHQAALLAAGRITNHSPDADSGSEVHRILSEAVRARHMETMTAGQLRQLIEAQSLKCRPDVQPQVVAALRQTYGLTRLLCYHDNGADRAPEDILRYDGGRGEYSGQLGADIVPANDETGEPAIRLTCEVDLLLATASEEEGDLYDWKSGHKHWTATDVRDSFQFQFYAYLVAQNYPKVKRINVRVWMTREGQATSPVTFGERDWLAIGERLKSAVDLHQLHAGADPEDVPAWPGPDKCSICPAAQRCRMAHEPEADLSRDPEAYLRQFVALSEIAARMKTNLTAAVRKRGKDFVFPGVAFGADKPKQVRAAACDYYDPKKNA